MTLLLWLLAFLVTDDTLRAEVPLRSLDDLSEDASHIVVGKVQDVFSATKKSDDWEDTKSIAEILVSHIEKGTGIDNGDVIYVHYWKKKWIGSGNPEPFSTGHSGASQGDTVRTYLEIKNGRYQVLLPNGFAPLTSAELKDASSDLDAEDEQLAELQGKWVRTLRTDKGVFKVTKEHEGNKTIVAVMDSDGQIVEEKTSEFRVETTGKVRIFTFYNNVVTAGPHKGQKANRPSSYIYRITGDKFVEVRGLLIGDNATPGAFAWERVKQ